MSTSNPNPSSETLGLSTLNHFGIGVRDLDRSVRFYRALTGSEPAGRGTWSSRGLGRAVGQNEQATIRWAAIRLGNVNVDLLEVQEPTQDEARYDLAQPGGLHVCFEVKNLPAVYERMEAAGIEFLGPWHEVTAEEDGAESGEGTVVAYFDGPDGEHLELIQPAGPFTREAMAEAAGAPATAPPEVAAS